MKLGHLNDDEVIDLMFVTHNGHTQYYALGMEEGDCPFLNQSSTSQVCGMCHGRPRWRWRR